MKRMYLAGMVMMTTVGLAGCYQETHADKSVGVADGYMMAASEQHEFLMEKVDVNLDEARNILPVEREALPAPEKVEELRTNIEEVEAELQVLLTLETPDEMKDELETWTLEKDQELNILKAYLVAYEENDPEKRDIAIQLEEEKRD